MKEFLQNRIKKHLSLILWLILIIFSAGCSSENPNLVSPEPPSKTVRFRLLNFCNNPLSLLIGGTVETASAPKDNITPSVQPPLGDSVSMVIRSGGSEIFRMPLKFKLIRDTKYTMFSLPEQTNLDPSGKFDSLIWIGTSLSLMLNENKSYITVLNALPDTTKSFNVNIGCPNGEAITMGLNYRQISPQAEITFGNSTISLSQAQGLNSKLIDLYDFNFANKGEYVLIVRPDANNNPALFVLDLVNQEITALKPAIVNNDRSTNIRAINFSSDPVKIFINDTTNISCSSNHINDYQKYTACRSSNQDMISVINGKDTTSFVTAQLDVNKNYSVLVFDSASKKGALTIVANPIKFISPLGKNCAVRIVHAAYSNSSLTVSIGSRKDTTAIGYKSGEVLASNITYGQISNPAIISAGRAPITLFTSNQPPNLLLAALPDKEFEAGKSYLLIITNDQFGFNKLTLIEEGDSDSDINDQFQLKKGIFTQIVHANSSANTLNIGINDIASSKVFFKGFLATVLPIGTSQLYVNGTANNYSPDDTKKRGLLIIGENNKVYDFTDLPMNASSGTWKLRVINISGGPILCKLETLLRQETIEAGKSSLVPYEYGSTGKISIDFVNPDTKKSVYRLDGVELSFGLNYSLIFNGSTAIQKSEY